MVHVMPVTGLGGTTMSAPVVGYNPMAVIEEKHHLIVPIISRERPAVTKHDGLPFAPILVVNLGPIFCRDCSHRVISLGLIRFRFVALGARAAYAVSGMETRRSGRRNGRMVFDEG